MFGLNNTQFQIRNQKRQKTIRDELGQDRQLQIPRIVRPHPSKGGSLGYNVHWRESELNLFTAGLPTTACRSSIYNWKNRLNPYKSTGNNIQLKINGENQYLHIMYRIIFPYATADEVRTYLFNNAIINPQIFTRDDIYKTDARLKITSKVGSTTAFQALLLQNVIRRDLYYNLPPPLGIHLVPRIDLIDTDECAVSLQTALRTHGKAYTGVRCSAAGNYCHDEKWTLIMSIDSTGWRYATFDKVAGTTALIFRQYIRAILATLPAGHPRIFIWDNLKSHFSDALINEIYLAGHSVVPRPAYYPVDGPIEYVFNQVECGLIARVNHIRTEADLIRETMNVVANVGGFDETFRHCGY
jgi:hypothetical protein